MLKIYECEEKATKTGKKLKKLVVQKEGLQYPFKNVTAWEDLDIYNELDAGYQVPQGYEIFEKDSENINPNSGKPYKNRTLVKSRNENGTEKSDVNVMKYIVDLNKRVKALEDAIETTHNKKVAEEFGDYPEDDIKPEDIPF